MDNIPPEKHPSKEPLAITGNLTIKNGGVRLRTAALFAVLAFAGGNYLATPDPADDADKSPTGSVVPVIELKGAIAAGRSGGGLMPSGKNLNIDSLRHSIDKAFDMPGAVAVVLDVNSPGGSPTQSELIANHIRLRAEEKKIPVYAFVQDVAASGGYWIACAANEIYTAKTSTVGSIGVIASGMGYSDLAQKLGVESRTYTAGKSKSRLDPMKPEMPEDVADLKRDLNELHGLFKGWIKECRGDRIVKKDVDLDNDVFTGRTWIGENAYKIGLTDGIAQMGPFIKKKFGDDVRLVTTTSEKASLLSMLAGAFSSQAAPEVSVSPEAIGKGIAAGTAEELERKAIWGRYEYK